MATSRVNRLESVLTQVMHVFAAHSEPPVAGVTSAEAALLVELAATGEASQQQLADQLGIDKSRVSRLCSSLERKGLLSRQRDESNRRNLRVKLTSSGAATARRLRTAWRERHQRMLVGLTADEQRALLVGLEALVREATALHQHG